MKDNTATVASRTPETPNPELVAEYRFIITFETYPDQKPVPEETEREVMLQVEKALQKDFADEVEFQYGGLVQVKVGPLEPGSILGAALLVLASGVSAADFFSRYKDFYDSFILLRSQLRAILNRVLNRTISQNVYRTVNVTFIPGPATRAVLVVASEQRPRGIPALYSQAFFIYLLVMNIVLMIIVFVLVYHAVATMYFRTP